MRGKVLEKDEFTLEFVPDCYVNYKKCGMRILIMVMSLMRCPLLVIPQEYKPTVWLSMRNKELRKCLLRESEGVSNFCFGYIISMPKDLSHVMGSKMYNKYVLFQFWSNRDFIQAKVGNSHIYKQCKQGRALW